MKKEIEIVLSPEKAFTTKDFTKIISNRTGYSPNRIKSARLLKRSVDARSRDVKIRMKFELCIDENVIEEKKYVFEYKDVHAKKPVIIVGCGPAGLFAALHLLEQGIKPLIIERGKNVSERKLDIAALNRDHLVNPDSNYCFGEGGAGTFSDGKLYTRSTKRGDVNRILQIFIDHGASEDILIDAHPHIGSDKLPAIISAIRKTIIDAGGEFFFNEKVIDFTIYNDTMTGVKTSGGAVYEGDAVILATGHSARDIYELLSDRKIKIESKPFAAGIRIEHPQVLIDSIQYHCEQKDPFLPAATYSLVQQINGRGVFSFCMCPGGIIVPSATGPQQVVTNGMSNSLRNSSFANAGIVVTIEEENLKKYSEKYGELGPMKFQEEMEANAYTAAGSRHAAPAQRMTDFVLRKTSSKLNSTSYHPGIVSAPLHELLPDFINERLRIAFREFDKKMRGFYTSEANILGVESRTSSPVRIPRNDETLEHIQIRNLYPCGEGSGYAGGIVSSAIDGERCAAMIAGKLCR